MSNKDNAKNKTQQAKGKLKEIAGQVTRNESLKREGRRDHAKGDLKQARENVKDAMHT